jgi:hypothetical protein
MEIGATNLNSGDKLILSAGSERRIWTVSAVNNQVVKYFDENGRYGQMPLAHLAELMKNHQLEIAASGSE